MWLQAKKISRPGADAKPRISSGGQASSGGFLPGWLESAIQHVTGMKSNVNKTMACLDRRYEVIAGCVEGIERKHMAHITGLFCPSLAIKGEARVHTNNGCFVAVKDDVVYARCSDCTCSDVQQSGSFVDIVEGTESKQIPWIRLDENMYGKMVDMHDSGENPGAKQTLRRKKART